MRHPTILALLQRVSPGVGLERSQLRPEERSVLADDRVASCVALRRVLALKPHGLHNHHASALDERARHPPQRRVLTLLKKVDVEAGPQPTERDGHLGHLQEVLHVGEIRLPHVRAHRAGVADRHDVVPLVQGLEGVGTSG
eukprot:scaffold94_cov254-Pinguiococcus_pyrenoidosus.AAC.5